MLPWKPPLQREGQGTIRGNSGAVLLPSCFELSPSTRGLAGAIWIWHLPIYRQFKGMQRAILHPHGNISVPQLLQTDCCLLPTKKILTHPCLNTRLSQERRSEGNVKCSHGIQSRLDGYDCINTEGYVGTFSIAWYTALKRKGMHGRGTVTIWKAKQDLQGTRLKLLSEAEKSESSKQPNATAPSELWGWGSKTVKRVIRCSDSFQFHPVRSQAFITWEENN